MSVLLAATLVLAACGPRLTAPPAATDPLESARAASLLRERQASVNELNYQIRPGDTLQIRVFQMDELSGAFHVSETGTVVMSLVGAVPVAGLTARQAADRLRREVTKLKRDPQVTVAVSEFQGMQVSLIGSVTSPGLYSLHGPEETIGDVLSEAGGITRDAGPRIYFIPASGTASADREQSVKLGLARAATAGPGPKNALTIDLTRLYQGREAPELRIPLRGGDTIMVPPAGEVYVDGWVATPGGVPLSRGMTFTQAVANAGGLHFAASRGPFTLQRSTAEGDVKQYVVDYSSILGGAEPDPYLQPGDRIQVSFSTVKVVPWALFNMVTFGAGAGGGVSTTLGKK